MTLRHALRPLTAEGACRWEQYCILVRIETAWDKKPLQAHAWGEVLLKDFFQATIGILYAIMIISLTECMLFAPGRSKDLGMSYEDSRVHCQQLNGIHPWVGSAMEVTTLQRTVKEGRYDVAIAKQYMHERTKERLAKMRALPTPSPTESRQPWHSLPESARGHGMTRLGTPTWESCPATPEAGQYDSPDVDDQKRTSPAKRILTVRMNIPMRQAAPDDPCQLSIIAGGTVPCIERGHVLNATFLKVAQHEAGSWLSLCSERLTKMTAFRIMTGGPRLRLPWPKAMNLNASRSPCLKQWRV